MDRHHIVDDFFRIDYKIKLVLQPDDKIVNFLDSDKIAELTEIKTNIDNYKDFILAETQKLYDKFTTYASIKDFALVHKKDKYFYYTMKKIHEFNMDIVINEVILKKISSYYDAIKFYDSIKN